MTTRHYSSTAVLSWLVNSINNSVTTVVVTSVQGFPTSYPYTIIIDRFTMDEEVLEVTSASGTTLTVVRGVDDTTPVGHTAGVSVEHGVSARDFRESDEHRVANANVHGVTGPLAGLNAVVQRAGDTMSGALYLSGDPVDPDQAANRHYVDAASTSLGERIDDLDVLVSGGYEEDTGAIVQGLFDAVNLHKAEIADLQERVAALESWRSTEVDPQLLALMRFLIVGWDPDAPGEETGHEPYQMGYPNALATWLFPRLREDVDNMLDDLEAVINKAEGLRIRAGGMDWVSSEVVSPPPSVIRRWELGEEFRAFLYVERSYQTYSIASGVDYGVPFDIFGVVNRFTYINPLNELSGHTFQTNVSGYYRYSARVTFNSSPDDHTVPYALWLHLNDHDFYNPDNNIHVGRKNAAPLPGVDYLEINGVIPIRANSPHPAILQQSVEMKIRQESGAVQYINYASLSLEWIGPLALSAGGSNTGWDSEYGIDDPTFTEVVP
jgi:hypothetical protein